MSFDSYTSDKHINIHAHTQRHIHRDREIQRQREAERERERKHNKRSEEIVKREKRENLNLNALYFPLQQLSGHFYVD